jgi:RND family efflux transporter MFP subunit
MKVEPTGKGEVSRFREAAQSSLREVESLSATSHKAHSPRRRYWWILGLLALLVLVAFNIVRSRTPEVRVATASVQELRASFTAEAYVRGKEYLLSPEIPGRISEFLVREGDAVRTGQPLFRVEDSEQQAVLEQAKAGASSAMAAVRAAEAQLAFGKESASAQMAAALSNLEQAEARRDLVLAGPRREELDQAGHHVESLLANFVEAEQANFRAQTLYRDGAVSRANADAAEARYKASRAAVEQARAALDALRAGPRPEEIRTARGAVASALAEIARSRSATQEVQVRREAVLAARAELAAATSAVQRYQSVVSKAIVRAPDDGVISKVILEKGMMATPGVATLVLSSKRDLRIDAEISSEDASKVVVGMPVTVTSPAYTGRIFPAKIVSLSPVGELKPDAAIRTRIVRTRVELTKDWEILRPGMEVDVEGESIIKKGLLIPSDAVMLSAMEVYVWVILPDGTVSKRSVKTGFTNAMQTEVLEGLREGERVVVDGKEGVRDGHEVRVRK